MNEEELFEAAEAVHDGWFTEGRIDWHDFLDRLETYADVDLGSDMLSPQIVAIKKQGEGRTDCSDVPYTCAACMAAAALEEKP